MSIQDIINTIIELFLNFICSIYNKFEICKLITASKETTSPEETTSSKETTSPESSQICPNDTCTHDHSNNEYTMPYSSELNLNSSCDDIKDYILSNLESINPDAFHSSDETPITNSMKKELIYVLENRTDMITNGGSSSPGIRFKFCCPTEQNCIL